MTPVGSKIFVLIMEVLGDFPLYIHGAIIYKYCIVILCSMSIEISKWLYSAE